MSQRLTLPQHLRQTPRSLIANCIAAQVQMSQRLAPLQHLRQTPRVRTQARRVPVTPRQLVRVK
eukprot:2686249-Rhodomonas_salina.1